jgi:hypothetical protein
LRRPLFVREGVDVYPMRLLYLLLLQSGHGHWSHPQPVQAERIMRQMISARAAPL